jgi:hypothetical protein
MKLKIYFIVVMATLLVASAKSQEMLVNGNFAKFSSTTNYGWWPDSWLFSGSDPFKTSAGSATMTANSAKKLEFENYATTNPGTVNFREAYQIVKLGIGTFHIVDTVKVGQWDAVSPYNVVVTDPQGVELIRLNHGNTAGAYQGFVSPDFVTTKDASYKLSIQCKKDGSQTQFSTAYFWFISLMQTDGNAYDPAADMTATKDVLSKACNAIVVGNKIVLSSEEQIQDATILGLNGCIINKVVVNKNNFEIAKPTQSGVYFVKMQTASQNKIVKILVNN